MLLRKFKTLIYALYLLSASVFATNFSIDFTSSKSYVDTLNHIRDQIADPIQHLSMRTARQTTSVLMLRSPPTDQFLRISLDGIDIDQRPGQHSNIQLILNSSNLYIMGWVNVRTNTFYRFEDFASFSLPNVTRTVSLAQDSSYTTLQRVGNTNRLNMVINRLSLTAAYHDLNNFDAFSLNQETARSLLRIITVTAEALRFRSIQRGFRPFLDIISPAAYIFGPEEVELTLNWARVSNTLPDHQGNQPVRVGRITLDNLAAILGTVAVILNCRHNTDGHSRTRRSVENIITTTGNHPDCPHARPLVLHGILWDSVTIDGVRQALSRR